MTGQSIETRRVWVGLLAGLVFSGVAGILNQVVWQRALKIFLGGSETLSAMIVVLAFLLGLGVGAGVASRVVARLENPLRALGWIELALALGNTMVALILALDITETIYGVERLAVASHVPLRLVYALGAALLLLPPTVLMGATIPLASEGCQRQLGASTNRLVPVLFFVNTVGASLGAYLASAWLLPALGQRFSLMVAVGCNGTAAVLIGTLARSPAVAPRKRRATKARGRLTREEIFGGILGFLALGYEMALFRLLALTHMPVPTTFATGLAGYLLAWSIGVALAGRLVRGFSAVALASALGVVGVLYQYDREIATGPGPLVFAVALYTLPCVGFGLLYGQLVTRSARNWGRDVGRYAAVNTLGSCAGVLFFTLVGYEMPQAHALRAMALGLCAVALAGATTGSGTERRAFGIASVAAVVGAVALLVVGVTTPYSEARGRRTYWGRDGVVEVAEDHNVFLDGLWHTKLSDGGDHVGSRYSWLMAFAAAVAHGNPHPTRALVIGGGVGISSGTLAGIQGLEVDVYEINHTLQRVLRDFPEETLHATTTPGVHWRWRDGRTGLALNLATYDIILSAPLYLRQAGSSLLLSREYLRLVKSRLAPDGVLAVYSNEGSPAQTRMIQRTLAELFRHRVTWNDGLLTVASDQPIMKDRQRMAERLNLPDRLYREAAQLDESMRPSGGLFQGFDGERHVGVQADRVVTDDQPLIEYPELADRWVGTRAP
jgi:spermidine synthase